MAIDSEALNHSGPNDIPDNVPGGSQLVGWVMGRVNRWRTVRNANYLSSWDDYYNIWRGVWTTKLQNREIERSKLISPATQQAVDSTVAEMVEATFGRGMWFDIDDIDNEQNIAKAQQCRVSLLEDFQRDHLKESIIEAFAAGAIYGTGIAKRIVDEGRKTKIVSNEYLGVSEEDQTYTRVYWEAIPPFSFVIDTTAKTVDEALGCAHETVRPYHEIKLKQRAGEFFDGPIGTMSGYSMSLVLRGPRGESLEIDPEDGVYITEYHGLVPDFMLQEVTSPKEDNPLAGMEIEEPNQTHSLDDADYVEAIVTIGNGGTLLKAVKNPFGGDRGFVAYPHDKVPNRFWGRGVCEKAWNSQKALDSQLRARIDALALMTYPVMGADATRLPRNLNLQITPGKTIFTNGVPNDVLQPLQFGNMDPASFQQSGDLERMVQMATGAMDSASPVNINSRNETAAGASMMSGSMVKRAKLTMQNVDSYFLQPLVNKSLKAYRVLDPQRYPYDVSFRVNTTMSVMAREYEQTQMTNLLAIIPPESPVFLLVLKALIENYSGPSKDKMIGALDQMMKPDPQKQKQDAMMQQLQMRAATAEIKELEAKVGKLTAEVGKVQAETHKTTVVAALEPRKYEIQAEQADIARSKTLVDAHRVATEAHQSKVDSAHRFLESALTHHAAEKDRALEHHHRTIEHGLEEKRIQADKEKAEAQAAAAKANANKPAAKK